MKKMNFLVIILCFIVGGCKTYLLPGNAAPGDRVTVIDKDLKKEDLNQLQIVIGNQEAEILNTTTNGQIQILLPNIKEGKANLVIKRDGKKIGETTLKVNRSPVKRLVLSIDRSNNLSLLKSSQALGEFHQGFDNETTQLSYDLLSKNGNLVFSGSIPHPAKTTYEVFDNPNLKENNISQVTTQTDKSTFSLKVSSVEGIKIIKFYEAPRGIDLSTKVGRTQRTFIKEFNIN